ncbi:hypothetical protein BBK14_30580 [Parafrankia soli]|uniref:Uncharacterized protein n=1 Tax=Parafrankia soli TaxID=2599596 RepID=A0A1S1RJA5_9ACTN|nr:hypothetical protein BBK14_30580 [Parafrankia soli]
MPVAYCRVSVAATSCGRVATSSSPRTSTRTAAASTWTATSRTGKSGHLPDPMSAVAGPGWGTGSLPVVRGLELSAAMSAQPWPPSVWSLPVWSAGRLIAILVPAGIGCGDGWLRLRLRKSSSAR